MRVRESLERSLKVALPVVVEPMRLAPLLGAAALALREAGIEVTPEVVTNLSDSYAAAADPAAYLVSFEPQNPQFKALRKKLAELRGGGESATAQSQQVRVPPGPMLKLGDRHPHVAILRARLNVKEAEGVAADEYGPALADAVREIPACLVRRL